MSASSNIVRITVEIGDPAWHGQTAERFWATPLAPNEYVLENSPLYAKGLSYKDVVSGKRAADQTLLVDQVLRRGGHSTYQILLNGTSTRPDFERQWAALEKLGCTYESSKDPEDVFAVDVPPKVDVYAVYHLLEEGEREGVWQFAEGFCGHPLKH